MALAVPNRRGPLTGVVIPRSRRRRGICLSSRRNGTALYQGPTLVGPNRRPQKDIFLSAATARLVSGPGFSRAEQAWTAHQRCHSEEPQATRNLLVFPPATARLKPCPDTNRRGVIPRSRRRRGICFSSPPHTARLVSGPGFSRAEEAASKDIFLCAAYGTAKAVP